MCLSIPGKIIRINGKRAIADFASKQLSVNTELIKVKKDDYVMVYSGYAMEKIDEKKAKKILDGLKGR